MQLTGRVFTFLLVLCPSVWTSLSVLAAVAQEGGSSRDISWASMPVPSVKMRPDISRNPHSKVSCARRCAEKEDCNEFSYDKASGSCLLKAAGAVSVPSDVLPASASRCYKGNKCKILYLEDFFFSLKESSLAKYNSTSHQLGQPL
jgi:hypothetical protein